MKRKYRKINNYGITLISLVITIILLIILAGITINLSLGENGIFKKAIEAKNKTEESQAREKLDIILLNLQAEKEINAKYNKDEYLTNKIEEQEILVLDDDIVLVNDWMFKIDRDIPKVLENLGKYKNNDNIEKLTLSKQKIIIGITRSRKYKY